MDLTMARNYVSMMTSLCCKYQPPVYFLLIPKVFVTWLLDHYWTPIIRAFLKLFLHWKTVKHQFQESSRWSTTIKMTWILEISPSCPVFPYLSLCIWQCHFVSMLQRLILHNVAVLVIRERFLITLCYSDPLIIFHY